MSHIAASQSGVEASGVVPIPASSPELHKERFYSLAKDFKGLGINLDSSGSDICRLRIYSWDGEAYFNHNAKLYTKILKPQHKTFNRPVFSDTRERVEAIISQLKVNKTDITGAYEDWLRIASALANEFGESGRGYFHSVSMFHPDYNVRDADRMFDNVLKHDYNKVTIGSFFKIASDFGVSSKNVPFNHLSEFSQLTNRPTSTPPILHTPVTTLPQVKKMTSVKSGPWDDEITELEEFFKTVRIPPGPIRMDGATLITNPAFTINAELNIIKAQNGKPVYKVDMGRLQALKKILVN